MKSTDIARMQREQKKSQKKEDVIKRKTEKEGYTLGDYIKELGALYFHDNNRILNIEIDEKIAEEVMEIKENIEEKSWEAIIRKSIKRTGVKDKEDAVIRMKKIFDEN